MTTPDPGLDVAELRALLDRKPLLTRTEALPLLDRLEAREAELAKYAEQAEWLRTIGHGPATTTPDTLENLLAAMPEGKALLVRLEAAEEALARVRALADEWKTEVTAPFGEAHMSYAFAQHSLRAAIEGPTP